MKPKKPAHQLNVKEQIIEKNRKMVCDLMHQMQLFQ
jgi:hypothetical protein